MRGKILAAPGQVAVRLRDELVRGRWSGTLPGIHRLAAELGFPRKPVERALLILENEGILEPQGVGRRRRIMLPEGAVRPGMLVGMLLYEPADYRAPDVIEIRHRLMEAGITVSIPAKTLTEMAMNAGKVAHIRWEIEPVVRRILGWVANMGRGKDDRKRTNTKAEFVEGGTIGPARS